ncbi:MAG: hypothetical protein ACTS4U_01225 [Candidatus Hodgkinia cicadicola]
MKVEEWGRNVRLVADEERVKSAGSLRFSGWKMFWNVFGPPEARKCLEFVSLL